MSITPIWDATLADAPANIWEASNIFPRYDPPILPRTERLESLIEALVRIGHPAAHGYNAPHLQPAFTDWSAIVRNVA